jgi:hypothetical protein
MNSKNEEILNSLQMTLKEKIELKNLETLERLEILQKLLKKFNFELEIKNEESTEECKRIHSYQDLLRNYSMLFLCRFDDENLIKGNCSQEETLKFFENILKLLETQNEEPNQNNYVDLCSTIIRNSDEIFQTKFEAFPRDLLFKEISNVEQEMTRMKNKIEMEKQSTFQNVETKDLKEFLKLFKKFKEIYETNFSKNKFKHENHTKEISKKFEDIIQLSQKLEFVRNLKSRFTVRFMKILKRFSSITKVF